MDEVTVTPTLNDTSASYEIQDDEGAALTDVDTTQNDFQVSISPGPNTINVVITGADGHTTQTYTVTVQRINILVSNIDQATAVATCRRKQRLSPDKARSEVHHRQQHLRLYAL